MKLVWPRTVKGWLISFVLGTVLLTGVSEAHAFVVTGNAVIQRDLAIAHEYWNATPKCPEVVEVAPLVNTNAYAESFQPGCLIKINPTYWPNYELHGIPMGGGVMMTPELARTCATIVHEYGHSLGYGHSTDPTNVMYPSPTANGVLACKATWEPVERDLTEETIPNELAALEPAIIVHRHHRKHHHRKHHAKT